MTAELFDGGALAGAVEIRLAGQAATQGSMAAIPLRDRVTGAPVLGKGGRQKVNVITPEKLTAWRAAVVLEAQKQMRGRAPLAGPCSVRAVFTFTRPAGHFGTGRNTARLRDGMPSRPVAAGKNDLDKLARAVLDALTMARVWGDDAQCAELTASKVWAGEHPAAFLVAGALIRVEVLA